MLRKIKIFMVLTLAIVMCATSFQSALAAGPFDGTEDDPARAAIAKVLLVPFGTVVPKATFEFTVTPIEVDDVNYDAAKNNMPRIGDLPGVPGDYSAGTGIFTLNFETGTGKRLLSQYPDENDNSTWVYETADIFEGAAWRNAGIYKYEITETINTYTIEYENTESMKYSIAKYTLDVYVQESTTTPGKFYVSAIAAVITVEDYDGQGEGTKVDPTPGGNDVTKTGYSDMTFTNEYWKHTGSVTEPKDPTDPTTPTDPEYPTDPRVWTLAVSKTTGGTFGNKEQYFDFTMSITAPSLVSHTPPPVYRAFVVEKDPTDPAKYIKVVSEFNYSGTRGLGGSILFTSRGPAVEFSLKDGQQLVFVSTPVGTSYDVTELGFSNYIASVNVSYAAYPNTTASSENTTTNTNLRIPNDPILSALYPNNDELMIKKLYVGEGLGKNLAAFTNTRETSPLTGLNLNNLPFFAMIALAVGALVMFVAIKSRKQKNATPIQ